MRFLGGIWVFSLVLVNGCLGFQFYLEYGKTQCFSEFFHGDTKVVAEYLVATGEGEMPVDFSVVDEDGKAIYQKAGISHGRFSFTTPSTGGSNYEDDYYDYEADDYGASGHSNMKYEVCFSNVPKGGGDTKQKRKVAFKILKGAMTTDHFKDKQESEFSDVEGQLEDLNDELSELMADLEEVRLREDDLRRVNEKINKQVLFYSVTACVIMFAVGGYQLFHMKSFFKKKKII